MLIKNVLFDLDGTLIDSVPGMNSSNCSPRGSITNGRCSGLAAVYGPPIREVLAIALRHLSQFVITDDLDALEMAFRKSYDAVGWRMSVLYPGVVETLHSLVAEHFRCFIVTNKPTLSASNILRELNIAQLFVDAFSRDSRHPAFKSKGETMPTTHRTLHRPGISHFYWRFE